MHKVFLNMLELHFDIRPCGPILIKSGVAEGVDPTLPNMNFVRGTHPAKGMQTIYLPGSSLKGTFRSHAERIVRTLLGEKGCCDPLDSKSACGDKEIFKTDSRRDKPLAGSEVYRELCPICQMFGHTVMASRLMVPDAYPTEPIDVLPVRQMVAIDRRSGGSVNTFDMEVATEGTFKARVILRNFERWQVGLLMLVLRDLALGRIGLGFGKSRGLGQVMLNFERLMLVYPGSNAPQLERYIYGAGELASHMAEYDFARSSLPEQADLPQNKEVSTKWAQMEISISEPDDIVNTLQSQIYAWSEYVGGRT